jgi:hypothetical protein
MLLLGDVVLDAPPPSPMVTIVNEKGGLLVAPLGDGLDRPNGCGRGFSDAL